MYMRERFNLAFKYLMSIGLVHKQRDVADRMNTDASYISKAIRGDDKVLTAGFLKRFNKSYGNIFDIKWLVYGEGEMLASKSCKNITQTNVNGDNNVGSIIMSDPSGIVQFQNRYDENQVNQMNWRPVVPSSISKKTNYDIWSHMEKQLGGNMERLYSGTANIDIWHYLEYNDLYPFYQKGDCLGLKAYEKGDIRIKTGDVYVADTYRDGLITRRMRIDENENLVTFTFNENDPQEFIIPKEDIIRIFRIVLMFRY